MRATIAHRLAPFTALAVAAVALVPAGAHASTAWLEGDTLMIRGGAEASYITFGDYLPMMTDAAGVVAGSGCVQAGATSVNCPPGWDRVDAALGDGDDSFRGNSGAATVLGEGGNDDLRGTIWADHLVGGPGNDTLLAGDGDDTLDGGPGDDTLRGHAGSDAIDAGPGRDNVEADGVILGAGNDSIALRDDEVDQATCGWGADTVVADRVDVIETAECESIDLPPVTTSPTQPAPPTQPGVSTDPGPMLLLLYAPAHGKLRTLVSRGVKVTCDFLASGRFTATLTSPASTSRQLGLGSRSIRLARVSGPVDEASYLIRLRPGARYRGSLRRARRATLVVKVTGSNAAGADSESARIAFRR